MLSVEPREKLIDLLLSAKQIHNNLIYNPRKIKRKPMDFNFLAIAGSCCQVASSGVALRAVWRKELRPSLSGGALFWLASTLAGLSTWQMYGAIKALLPAILTMAATIQMSIALLNRHHGGWDSRDSFLLVLGVLGLIGQVFGKIPMLVLACALVLQLCGYLAILKKCMQNPAQDSALAWGAATLACVFLLMDAIQRTDQEGMKDFLIGNSYLLLMLMFNAALMTLQIIQRRQVKPSG